MRVLLVILLVLAVVVGCTLLGGWVFQLLWNFVVPAVFNGPVLGYWHAVALTLLLGFLGGFIKINSK